MHKLNCETLNFDRISFFDYPSFRFFKNGKDLFLTSISSNIHCILTKTLIHVSVLYYQKTRMLRASNSAYYSYRDNKQRRPGYFRSISRYTVYLDDTYASIMLSYERVWLRNYSLSSDALEEGCH